MPLSQSQSRRTLRRRLTKRRPQQQELFAAPPPAPLVVPQRAKQQRLWLCLQFRALPLEALPVVTAEAQPRAVTILQGQDLRVLLPDALAAANGVCSGMGVNAALALCPELELHEQQPVHETGLTDHRRKALRHLCQPGQ